MPQPGRQLASKDICLVAPMGAQVVELGVTNATIHKVNECVATHEIELLEKMYLGVLENLLKE